MPPDQRKARVRRNQVHVGLCKCISKEREMGLLFVFMSVFCDEIEIEGGK